MTDTTTIAIGSAVISLMSFAISASTMYFAWLRRGRLRMTQPALVYFAFDAVPKPHTAKIFLRTLLYSTAAKGKVIESMHAKLLRDGTVQMFSVWGYAIDKLTPGSGLYVGQAGVPGNHHFVLSVHQSAYEFVAGNYTIEVFARLAGRSAPIQLSRINLAVDDQQASALRSHVGVQFDLQPDSGIYIGHVTDHHVPAEMQINNGKNSEH
jgi:hypothetical protein